MPSRRCGVFSVRHSLRSDGAAVLQYRQRRPAERWVRLGTWVVRSDGKGKSERSGADEPKEGREKEAARRRLEQAHINGATTARRQRRVRRHWARAQLKLSTDARRRSKATTTSDKEGGDDNLDNGISSSPSATTIVNRTDRHRRKKADKTALTPY